MVSTTAKMLHLVEIVIKRRLLEPSRFVALHVITSKTLVFTDISSLQWCNTPGTITCPSTCGHFLIATGHNNGCQRGQLGSRATTCLKGCTNAKTLAARGDAAILHGCAFGVMITATLTEMSEGSFAANLLTCVLLSIVCINMVLHAF